MDKKVTNFQLGQEKCRFSFKSHGVTLYLNATILKIFDNAINIHFFDRLNCRL